MISFNYVASTPDKQLITLVNNYQLDDPSLLSAEIDRLKNSNQHLLIEPLQTIENIMPSTTPDLISCQ